MKWLGQLESREADAIVASGRIVLNQRHHITKTPMLSRLSTLGLALLNEGTTIANLAVGHVDPSGHLLPPKIHSGLSPFSPTRLLAFKDSMYPKQIQWYLRDYEQTQVDS